MSSIVIDEKDRKILEIISKNPRVTQVQLAEMLGISQPAVSMRLSRLKELGLLYIIVGADPKSAKLAMAKIDIKARDINFLSDLAKCPYVVCASTSTGKFNVFLMMAGEDYGTLEAVVNRHIRSFEEVDTIEFNIILDHYGRITIPLKIVEKFDNVPSCAKKLMEEGGCKNCPYYKKGQCLGCPYLDDYRGHIFKIKVVKE